MISLNYRDASPIYEQIKNGLKRLIVTGALKEGDKLPSVRSLVRSWPSIQTRFKRRTMNWKTRDISILFPAKAPLPAEMPERTNGARRN